MLSCGSIGGRDGDQRQHRRCLKIERDGKEAEIDVLVAASELWQILGEDAEAISTGGVAEEVVGGGSAHGGICSEE